MSSSTSSIKEPATESVEVLHSDVIIVGAGLSGIGAAYHLQAHCPQKSLRILEMREAMGGTWDLFRYPGIRSDSDMYTLGYSFRPWKEAQAIADGPSILKYIRETAQEAKIDEKIEYQRQVVSAHWSSQTSQWPLNVKVKDLSNDQALTYTCSFLFLCSGYYDYEEGYTPAFEGVHDFGGEIVHPQQWPEKLDYTDRKVVVIGSGATAVTLVPAMAEKAKIVSMLQRSPTYILRGPSKDKLANFFRKVLPEKWAYGVNRWKKVLLQLAFYQLARKRPNFTKKLIKRGVRGALGKHYDIEKHFSPPYNPWDQRVCMIPDGDLFEAIKQKKAEIITGEIETFTSKGIRLKSGEEIESDIVVTATGLKVKLMGGLSLRVNGRDINLPEHTVYRGLMLSDVPNFAFALGYTNASWTLKTDLSSAYVCRLLNHMDKIGATSCTPQVKDNTMDDEPLIDFNAGYVLRALHLAPKQGSRPPWKLHQNYPLDVINFKYSSLNNDELMFR